MLNIAVCEGKYSVKPIFVQNRWKESFYASDKSLTLHREWNFPLKTFNGSEHISTVSCEFGLIYWRNP